MRPMDHRSKDFEKRVRSGPIREAVEIGEEGLLLGAGARLVRDVQDRSGIDRDERRLVALLSVAGGRLIADGEIATVKKALSDWRRGDRALANIRLAQASLPRIRRRDDAFRLHLAEQLLDQTMQPDELLKALGFASASSSLAKYDADQPRVPAGNGRASGQWASGGGEGTAATPETVEGRSAAVGAAPDGTPIIPAANADDPQGLKQAAAAAKAAGLKTDKEKRAFHDEITGQDIVDFNELVQRAMEVKKKTKPP